MNEVGFLIEVPTSSSSIEKLAKKGGGQIAHTYWQVKGTHQKKSGGHARIFRTS